MDGRRKRRDEKRNERRRRNYITLNPIRVYEPRKENIDESEVRSEVKVR